MLITILAILWQSFLIVTQRYDLVKRAFGLLWWWWGHIHPRHRFSHRGRPSVSSMWWWTMKPPSLLLLPTDNEVPGADVYLGPFTLLSKKKGSRGCLLPLRETTVEAAAASSSLKSSLQNFDRVLELLLHTTILVFGSRSSTRARIWYYVVSRVASFLRAHSFSQLIFSGRKVYTSRPATKNLTRRPSYRRALYICRRETLKK